MKYLKIQNKGLLDIRLISLMGATTKADDPAKIGQFGTGLKYAISYFVRNKIKFRLFIGTKEVVFTTKPVKIDTQRFDQIYCNGDSMNITTRYGYQWQAWEALREIWCNAKDAGGEYRKVADHKTALIGKKDTTTFFIPVVPAIKEVLDTWGNYFIDEAPLYSDDKVAIYANNGDWLRLYKNSVLIHTSDHQKSIFKYDLKTTELNELRQYRGYAPSDIARAILGSSKRVVSAFLLKASAGKELVENTVDWSFIFGYQKSLVKEIFQGYLFLHPASNEIQSAKKVMVSQTLFSLLESCGLPCEKINTTGGAYYGRSGVGYSQKPHTYREVKNVTLAERIDKILNKYDAKINYSIVVPKGSDFEISIIDKGVLFSSELDRKSDYDLESTVLICVFHSKQGNMYKAFQRLIKFAIKSRNFKNILFGK